MSYFINYYTAQLTAKFSKKSWKSIWFHSSWHVLRTYAHSIRGGEKMLQSLLFRMKSAFQWIFRVAIALQYLQFSSLKVTKLRFISINFIHRCRHATPKTGTPCICYYVQPEQWLSETSSFGGDGAGRKKFSTFVFRVKRYETVSLCTRMTIRSRKNSPLFPPYGGRRCC